MAFASSPVEYPPSSSPRELSPRKRRKLENEHRREPLCTSTDNGNAGHKTIAGFVVDDESDDEGLNSLRKLQTEKRSARSESFTRNTSIATTNELDVASEEPLKSNYLLHQTTVYSNSQEIKAIPRPFLSASTDAVSLIVRGSTGKTITVRPRSTNPIIHYSDIVAARSTTVAGRAKSSYYGIDIHALIDEANAKKSSDKIAAEALAAAAQPEPEIATSNLKPGKKALRTQLWTEKYRARKFTDLVGDERTHRSVLHWLKAWDPIVFPSHSRPTIKARHQPKDNDKPTEKPHRKILLLTGPPGLGKTTLAHVCAKQAGYEVQEINASDERSRDIVKGRIKDMVGTENVRPVDAKVEGKPQKATKPVCIVVDEVDGVTGGSGAGSNSEGGFIKALLELLALDHRNSNNTNATGTNKRKGESFRLLRPIILICNDIYHPSLRLLRQNNSHSSLTAEIIHVRKPALSAIVPRLQSIFEREGVPCDSDAARHLCESTWGVPSRKEALTAGACEGTGSGDMRGILVVGEWVASKFKNACITTSLPPGARLTRRWLESNISQDLASGGGSTRFLGRGGSKEAADRVFLHNAGFPSAPPPPSASSTTLTTTKSTVQTAVPPSTAQYTTLSQLREIIDSSGEDDRIITDVFTAYPRKPYQDNTLLTKPNTAHDWLHFHSLLSHTIQTSQTWELAPYLSSPILAFHTLFASPKSSLAHNITTNTNSSDSPDTTTIIHPLHTTYAARHANDLSKSHSAILTDLHKSLSVPLQQSFRSPASLTTDLIPCLLRMLNPAIKPVIVGGSERGVASIRRAEERALLDRAVDAMVACGVAFEKTRVDSGSSASEQDHHPASSYQKQHQSAGSVYRMTPPLEDLASFPTLSLSTTTTATTAAGSQHQQVRYSTRQVLAQAHSRALQQLERDAAARRAGLPISNTATSAAPSSTSHANTTHPNSTDLAPDATGKEIKPAAPKRDFFGRIKPSPIPSASSSSTAEGATTAASKSKANPKLKGVPEGGKPITMRELLEGV